MSYENRAMRAAETSLRLGDAKFQHLSAQVKCAYEKIDGALAHTLRMTGDMIETAQDIGLEPETGQKLFDELTACLDTMMTSRQQLLKAHRRATAIRMRTDQAARDDVGCWGYAPENNIVAISAAA